MQLGGGASGPGRNPAAAPPGRPSSSSSSASPSSSSSAASASTHLGFESIQQQQQQLALRQSLQQQQPPLRRSEGDPYRPGGLRGVIGGDNFPSSSGAISVSQTLRNFNDVYHPHAGPQLRYGNQNKGQGIEQQLQNPIHQAYLQLAFQTAQQQKSHGNLLVQQQGKINMVAPSGRDQDMHMNNLRIQDLTPCQAANQAQQSMLTKSAEHIGPGEKQMEQPHASSEKRNELKPPETVIGQITPTNMLRPMQSLQAQPNTENVANNQLVMAQLQAIQAWAVERNIDLSHPSNANLIAQVWQSAKLAAMQKTNEVSTAAQQACLPSSKQQALSSPGGSESSAHGNSLSDHSVKNQQTFSSGSISGAGGSSTLVNSSNIQMQKQLAIQNKENQNERAAKSPVANGNGGLIVHPPQFSGSMSQTIEHSNAKSKFAGTQTLPMQYYSQLKQMNQPVSQPAVPSTEITGTQFPSHGGLAQVAQQNIGFTKQQLHVLKAQILAFRRIKRGDRKLPQEVLDAITPPPLTSQLQQVFLSPGIANHERTVAKNVNERVSHAETVEKDPVLSSTSKGHDLSKEPVSVEEKATMVRHLERVSDSAKELVQIASVEQSGTISVKSEQDIGQECQKIGTKSDYNAEKGKAVPVHHATSDAGQVKKPASMSNAAKDVVATRKYHGPLFDFPFFTRKHESFGSAAANSSSNLILAYDVKDLLFEEGTEVFNKKRTENLRKINGLLAVNLERKRIRPDLVLRLQIEEKKLRLLDLQARLRDEIDRQQQEIMAMSDRPYRKFVKQCERQRMELIRQVQQLQKTTREKQLKSIFQWRKKLLEAHWAVRDARTTRNRGVAKYHERMLREFSKKKDDDRNKRMEALKNNDVDRYREMLLEQQTSIPGDAAQRYAVLSSFLSQTEEYLYKLGGKITAAKNHQDVVEAANVAAVAARSQGLSEEEVKAAAACAGEEVMIRNRFSEMNAPKDSSSVNKYYNLAHAVNERVGRQPSMLRAGTLRDYQLVGLQWMLSLYNNKLNGILADEMGLGKTVQVMALIAYLMEFKGNYGPHLIIVPNAVLVNWKSELHNWLPTVSCIFYVGGKDERSRLFSHEVCAMKFNVLVTTYEFIMYDRSRLSKIDWKYIIIDEAQRMKDRESVLARDLDRYRCQRRLLLTGTPLQNDLKELWSLLNLLLPEVFDNRKAFHDWFSKPFQRDGPSHSSEEDDWLETEKKVIIIHRLHQILEPFMLRRRVEDVEGALPRKDSIVLRCRMSAIQGAIYDWIKSTGTIRVDPEDELRRAKKNPLYQVKVYKNLNNKCMELRKACNHPLLNYPYFNDYSKEFIVRSCGKLWILDRILIKLQRAGHRVLLFSTMTKLLDILEEYLQWRRLVYRRIDGTTSLEDREAAIVDFNSPGSDCFIFLLSIRAAGRGLNLQSADTVVIYDPDPNPQNEEQAVARAYRIGQQREVKVIYMEAVVDKISSYQKEDDLRNGGTGDLEDDLAGKDRYIGSIESLIRNNIQQYKIDMADEVINAGRFDQITTHEERRMTLETLLHDEERYQETVHDVPSMQEVNRMIGRSEEEIELFDQMDEDFEWTGDMMKHNQVPKWLRAGSREVTAIIANLTKKPSKNILAENIDLESGEIYSGTSPGKTERRRGRPRGPTTNKNHSVYMELDDEDGEDSDASSEERNIYSFHEEEGEIGEFEEEESNGAVDVQHTNRNESEEQGLAYDDIPQTMEDRRNVLMFEEAGSSGSSSGSRRLPQPATPSVSSQKFGSLSALDARPHRPSERMQDELEEGEIAVSGDSQMDLQQSGSWINEREDGEDEQVLQPTIKRKRSLRVRPRHTVDILEEKSSNERIFSQCRSQLPLQVDHDYDMQFKTNSELETFSEPVSDRHDVNTTIKQRRNLPSRKPSNISMPKFSTSRYMSGSAEDANEHSRESRNSKATNTGDPSFIGTKMSDSMQRKCKNVISKLQRRIDKDGYQVVPLISDLWKKNQNATVTSNVLDLRRIDQRVDNLEYNGVLDFIADVQSMLQNVVHICSYSYEVKYEARKLHDMFFDIMKIAFPDTDFREARNAFTFSSPGVTGTSLSPKLAASSQSKPHKTVTEVKPEPGPVKLAPRGPVPPDEDGRTRGRPSKSQKESRPAGGSGGEHPAPELSPLLTHPGDLVICKKKRKDRDKPAVKRMAPMSLPGPGPVGPLSATNPRQVGPKSPPSNTRSPRIPVQKDSYPTQQALHPNQWAYQPEQQAVGGIGGPPRMDQVQWAKPVKKMRTDTGKRRPSHL
ncbi:ATP-dependent helicase BRM [Elaeis guineensis]|uniref:ATP-dependent helicase BRM isoform X1 n=1 Tax=Elaeis guineensis var. tenera TaxID=51953 RepID=A0A6I9RV71_ELAGV|nr:ATP-dependent helicase BRM isoform X1 [Elaeis guineensis]